MCHWGVICLAEWFICDGSLGSLLASLLQHEKGVKSIKISSSRGNVRRYTDLTGHKKCSSHSPWCVNLTKKQPHRSHSNAHLEPKTPLSSSSTVLSLFCSSFSRSLASASSCQKAEKVVTTLLLHSTKTPLTRPLNPCFLGCGEGWGWRGWGVESCSRHRGATCLAGGLRLILPAICVERYPEYKWTCLTSEHCHGDCSPRHQMWYQHRERCLARSLKTCCFGFFSHPTTTQIYGETMCCQHLMGLKLTGGKVWGNPLMNAGSHG